MSITTQFLLTKLGERAWSGFNKDDMFFGSDESATALAELNAAHRYLMSLEDFPFRNTTAEISTIKGFADYPMIDGQIKEIYNKSKFSKLNKLDNPALLEEKRGEPIQYYIRYSNPDASIVLHPVPDGVYTFNVIYDTYKFILDKKGNPLDEFTNADDILNMPSYLEYLYMDCLILRTMITNNKDREDENYAPMISEFEETWQNFTRKARPEKIEQRIII